MNRELMKEWFGRPLTDREKAEYWQDAIPDEDDAMFSSEEIDTSRKAVIPRRRGEKP
ncbi:hypothetical protein [Paenibacillus sp. YYML68]|uniref:hypothetical protein n=1 Tax=Paenibacillus sp. YYML68 TaxID=2909250 RepID=UPI002492B08F|nr:hypothetical protein [Paenibacillus sp. YYML68]